MSEVIRFTLRGDVSWINADIYPDLGGCNVMCLTDRQVSIIRQMVYPHALSPSRFVVPGWDRRFTYPSAELAAEHIHEVEDLIDKLGTEATVDCQALLDALATIAFNVLPAPAAGYIYNNTNLSAGNNTLTILTVAADHQVIVNNLVIQYTGGTASGLYVMIDYTDVDMSTPYVVVQKPVASGIFYQWQVRLNLSAGDALNVLVANATAGDDIFVSWTGTQAGLVAGN